MAPADLILAWYDRHHRDLPWRVSPPMAAAGIRPDPYRIWLSEVMLQQTTVQAVKSYFALFTSRYPRRGSSRNSASAYKVAMSRSSGYRADTFCIASA